MISGYYKDHNISITAFLHLLKNNSVPRGLRMKLLSCTCPIKLTIFNYRIKMNSQIDLVLIGFFLYKSCTLHSFLPLRHIYFNSDIFRPLCALQSTLRFRILSSRIFKPLLPWLGVVLFYLTLYLCKLRWNNYRVNSTQRVL